MFSNFIHILIRTILKILKILRPKLSYHRTCQNLATEIELNLATEIEIVTIMDIFNMLRAGPATFT